jgi:hypothetical protein
VPSGQISVLVVPDGDGFVLLDPRSQSPVVNDKGQYFRVRYKDVERLAAGKKRQTETETWGP